MNKYYNLDQCMSCARGPFLFLQNPWFMHVKYVQESVRYNHKG
jgi:hypothetical protein